MFIYQDCYFVVMSLRLCLTRFALNMIWASITNNSRKQLYVWGQGLWGLLDRNASLSDIHNAKWVDVDNMPALCFDHNDMVQKARRMIGETIKNKPIGSNLLPRYFTLSSLQTLYESILGTTIDKRNFRRSISEKDYILATDMIDKDSSRRGATLYRFR